jgi:hypothetical protein
MIIIIITLITIIIIISSSIDSQEQHGLQVAEVLSRTAEEAAATGIQLEVVDHNSLRHQNDPNIMHGASLCFL